jgi:hypothetical protein
MPSCCPYPAYFIAMNVFQIMNQTLTRLLLLVICLGYGIGRPRLLTIEIVCIAVLHTLYFVAACANQLYYIIHLNNYYHHPHRDPAYARSELHSFHSDSLLIFEVVINAMLLSWIYVSASSTIRILKEFQQDEKLKMYRRLVYILYLFIFLFVLITAIYMLDDQQILDWPWQLRWMQQAIYELLNLAVVAALCVLFKPTGNYIYI